MILIGACSFAIFGFTLSGIVFQSVSSGAVPAWASRQILADANVGLWGALILWTGIGCIRVRRWVRPLVLAEASVLLLFITSALLRDFFVLQLVLQDSAMVPMALLSLVRLAAGVSIPIAAVIYFRRENVRKVLWSRSAGKLPFNYAEDSLLAWSAGCVLFGLTTLIDIASSNPRLPRADSGILWILIYCALIAGGWLCISKMRAAWVATVLIAAVVTLFAAKNVANTVANRRIYGRVTYSQTTVNGRISPARPYPIVAPAPLSMADRLAIALPAFLRLGLEVAAVFYGIGVGKYLKTFAVLPTEPLLNVNAESPLPAIMSRKIHRNR